MLLEESHLNALLAKSDIVVKAIIQSAGGDHEPRGSSIGSRVQSSQLNADAGATSRSNSSSVNGLWRRGSIRIFPSGELDQLQQGGQSSSAAHQQQSLSLRKPNVIHHDGTSLLSTPAFGSRPGSPNAARHGGMDRSGKSLSPLSPPTAIQRLRSARSMINMHRIGNPVSNSNIISSTDGNGDVSPSSPSSPSTRTSVLRSESVSGSRRMMRRSASTLAFGSIKPINQLSHMPEQGTAQDGGGKPAGPGIRHHPSSSGIHHQLTSPPRSSLANLDRGGPVAESWLLDFDREKLLAPPSLKVICIWK